MHTCGILAEPNELVEDSESLRTADSVVALIGGFSMPWTTFVVEGEGGRRAWGGGVIELVDETADRPAEDQRQHYAHMHQMMYMYNSTR